MPNGPDDSELTYGGMVVGVTFGDERRCYGSGLVGMGNGELTSAIASGCRATSADAEHGGNWTAGNVVQNVRFDETFMVAEPQAEVALPGGQLASWPSAWDTGSRAHRITLATASTASLGR